MAASRARSGESFRFATFGTAFESSFDEDAFDVQRSYSETFTLGIPFLVALGRSGDAATSKSLVGNNVERASRLLRADEKIRAKGGTGGDICWSVGDQGMFATLGQ